MVSPTTNPILTNSNKHNRDSGNSTSSGNDNSASMSSGARRNYRHAADQNSASANRATTPSQTNVKSDRRKDIKLTNCQEKDGIWTATGQFGRESRHSKRTDITFDRKRFRFIQKDDQGNKQVSEEISLADIEGKSSFSIDILLYFVILCFSISFSSDERYIGRESKYYL